MLKKISVAAILIIFFNSRIIDAKELKYAEIFDPKQERVVKVVQLSTKMRKLFSDLNKNIDGIYGKHNPVTIDNEYIMKSTLNPKVKIHREWLEDNTKVVYIVFPKVGSPFFMYFKNEDKISCFPFDGNVAALYKTLTAN